MPAVFGLAYSVFEMSAPFPRGHTLREGYISAVYPPPQITIIQTPLAHLATAQGKVYVPPFKLLVMMYWSSRTISPPLISPQKFSKLNLFNTQNPYSPRSSSPYSV